MYSGNIVHVVYMLRFQLFKITEIISNDFFFSSAAKSKSTSVTVKTKINIQIFS